jgi:nucleotide-binding universal stress UspA family protein
MEMKTIVVPLDSSEQSERALPVAEAIARRINAGLLLVSAQFHGPLDPGEYLEEQAARVRGCPVDIAATRHEHAPAAIASALDAGSDRIVCMTTHGRGSLRLAALGSVAEEVIHGTDRPILLVGPRCRPDFLDNASELLVAVDRPEAAVPLAEPTRRWANALGLRRRVAILVHPLDIESAQRSDAVLAPLVEALELSSINDGILLRADSVAGALADCAEASNAGLIAMNTRARTGLARFVLGSETMGVLRHASCPLLVTHPQRGS